MYGINLYRVFHLDAAHDYAWHCYSVLFCIEKALMHWHRGRASDNMHIHQWNLSNHTLSQTEYSLGEPVQSRHLLCHGLTWTWVNGRVRGKITRESDDMISLGIVLISPADKAGRHQAMWTFMGGEPLGKTPPYSGSTLLSYSPLHSQVQYPLHYKCTLRSHQVQLPVHTSFLSYKKFLKPKIHYLLFLFHAFYKKKKTLA